MSETLLRLKFRAGPSVFNETPVPHGNAFRQSVNALPERTSGMAEWIQEREVEVRVISTKIALRYDPYEDDPISIVTHRLSDAPSAVDLETLIDETIGQLLDGGDGDPWEVETAQGTVLLDTMSFRVAPEPLSVARMPLKK